MINTLWFPNGISRWEIISFICDIQRVGHCDGPASGGGHMCIVDIIRPRHMMVTYSGQQIRLPDGEVHMLRQGHMGANQNRL